MVINPVAQDSPTTLDVKQDAGNYWQYPLDLTLTGFLLIGASGTFLVLFPSHPDSARLFGLIFTVGWRYVADIRTFSSPFGQNTPRRKSFSLVQAVADGFAFFIFMIALFGWASQRAIPRPWPAAIGAIAFGIYSGWYHSPQSATDNQTLARNS